MLEAMRSLLHTSIDSFAAPRVQAETQARPEKEPKQAKTYTPNQAVEVTLSPKAQQLLRALERQDITVDQIQETERRRLSQLEQASNTLPALDTVIDRVNQVAETFGTPEFSEDDTARLNDLFGEVRNSFTTEGGDNGNVGEDMGDGQTTGTTAVQDLPPQAQMKAAALFAELDRLLGGMGVFVGGDRMLERLSMQQQPQAREMRDHLAETLSPGTANNQLTPAQESRIDAILREIDRIYARAQDSQADARKDALAKLLSPDGAIQQPGGTDLAA